MGKESTSQPTPKNRQGSMSWRQRSLSCPGELQAADKILESVNMVTDGEFSTSRDCCFLD